MPSCRVVGNWSAPSDGASNPRWGARVVYGDTDSLFVHMPGRTVEGAHIIGQEIAAAVTAENPPPWC